MDYRSTLYTITTLHDYHSTRLPARNYGIPTHSEPVQEVLLFKELYALEKYMGYLHIPNLYKSQEVLLFKELYALEKIHGTSAHLHWSNNQLSFFAGGANHATFVTLFDINRLIARLIEVVNEATVYGEAYGGKMQGMSRTYGPTLRFVVFDVKIGDSWLSVLDAHAFTAGLGLEFVHYDKILTDMASIDAQMNADSVQAVRNGVGLGRMREGVILRPLIELRRNNNERIIAKHKRDEFRETKTPRPTVDPAQLIVLTEAESVAAEWVTHQRLLHVLDKIPWPHCPEQIPVILTAMLEDVLREGAGEIVVTDVVKKAIKTKTAQAFKQHLKRELHQEP